MRSKARRRIASAGELVLPELLCDVPPVACLLRAEHLYNCESHHGEYVPCMLLNVSSLEGRPLLFQVVTDGGALRDHLPISALCARPCDSVPLELLQLWSCFSSVVVAHPISYLRHLRVRVCLKDRSWHWGTYMWTFDWHGSALAEDPGEAAHKSGHMIQLDTGHFTVQPNNRLLVREPSFVTRPLDPEHLPAYKTNTQAWLCERGDKWVTSDDDRFFYGVTTV